MQAEHGDRGLAVLGVHSQEDPAALASFVKEHGVVHRILVDDGSAFRDYGITGIPFTVLLDREGRIAWTTMGWGEGLGSVLEAEVGKVLGGP